MGIFIIFDNVLWIFILETWQIREMTFPAKMQSEGFLLKVPEETETIEKASSPDC